MATAQQQPAAAGGGGGGGGPGDFIGALISLISKSDIRYQGFLAQIDPVAATIALEMGECQERSVKTSPLAHIPSHLCPLFLAVRSFGTEGRLAAQGKPNDEIPPNANVYEFVTFKAADVKDLKIDDPHPKREQPPQQQQQGFVDPAILGVSSRELDGYALPLLRAATTLA